jgi:hypothetical protein
MPVVYRDLGIGGQTVFTQPLGSGQYLAFLPYGQPLQEFFIPILGSN